VPGNIYSHISGIDIVRAANAQGEGEYYVLEDNCPLGQQQFFGIQRVHGLRHSRAVFHFPGGVVHDSCAVVAMQVLLVGTLTSTR
jgi:hypothetical protein